MGRVPERELLDERETIGFQREQNPARVDQLRRFLDDAKNVIQNPLLCSVRNTHQVVFTPAENANGNMQTGILTINSPNFASMSMIELFSELEEQLRQRQPALANATVDQTRLQALNARLQEELGDEIKIPQAEDEPAVEDDDSVSGLFSTETHVLEFWQEINARKQLLNALGDKAGQFDTDGAFLGFTREVLESYLRPVFLVDGQHRLRGAIESAEALAVLDMTTSTEAVALVDDGTSAEELTKTLTAKHCRTLPVSLLTEPNVAEHVFQFVVVNQKATPVGKALLGTIVASSLTEEELSGVSARLEEVGINVTDSRAVSWFTRSKESPFYGLVQQGMSKEEGGKLPWSVLRDLVSIFRNLRGGRLFHEDKVTDYADIWRRKYLENSKLLERSTPPPTIHWLKRCVVGVCWMDRGAPSVQPSMVPSETNLATPKTLAQPMAGVRHRRATYTIKSVCGY